MREKYTKIIFTTEIIYIKFSQIITNNFAPNKGVKIVLVSVKRRVSVLV